MGCGIGLRNGNYRLISPGTNANRVGVAAGLWEGGIGSFPPYYQTGAAADPPASAAGSACGKYPPAVAGVSWMSVVDAMAKGT